MMMLLKQEQRPQNETRRVVQEQRLNMDNTHRLYIVLLLEYSSGVCSTTSCTPLACLHRVYDSNLRLFGIDIRTKSEKARKGGPAEQSIPVRQTFCLSGRMRSEHHHS